MNTYEIVSNSDIDELLRSGGWTGYSIDEGRLKILELMSKAGAGYYNSHTEEIFVNSFGLLKKDRMPNKRGMKFIMSMVYSSSNKKPVVFDLIKKYRINQTP